MMNDDASVPIAMLDGGPLIDADQLPAALGWTLAPEGLCKDDLCIPVPESQALDRDGKLDVLAVAALLDRPAATDETSGLVAIGAPRDRRRSALHDLEAPEFVLPDLDGMPVALSDHRSKKRLLVAFSSW